MGQAIEEKFEAYNKLKIDLLKISKCIECCEESQIELYQDLCIEYSKELKTMKKSIEETYGVELCSCCVTESEIS